LPDMFEPLTSSTRTSPPSITSFRTQAASGSNGWPTDSPGSRSPLPRSRERSLGFSNANAASATRASNSPTADSQPAIAGPVLTLQESIAWARTGVHISRPAIGREKLVVLAFQQVEESGQARDPDRRGLALRGQARREGEREAGRREGFSFETRQQLCQQHEVVSPPVNR